MAVPLGEEKPVTAPGNIPADRLRAGNFNNKRAFGAPTRDIGNRHFAIFVQSCGNNPDRRFNAMLAGVNAAHVIKSGDEADGSVAAHAKVTDIVEKNDARSARGIGWLEKGCADDNIRAARFVDDRGSERVMLVAKNFQPFGDAAAAKVGAAANDDASGFATSMRVYDGNASHAEVPSLFARLGTLRRFDDENEGDKCPFPLVLDRVGTLGRAAMPS